jgi:hypothetical protein
MRFLLLQTLANSYSIYNSGTVHLNEKGGKPVRKPYPLGPLPYGLEEIHAET